MKFLSNIAVPRGQEKSLAKVKDHIDVYAVEMKQKDLWAD